MIYFIFFSFVLALHSPQPICKIDDSFYIYDVDLYQSVGKKNWDELKIEKKQSLFDDFIKKELVCFSAKKDFFDLKPKIQEKLEIRKNMLLINNAYEHFIARPLLDSFVVAENFKNLSKSVFVSHVLVGFDGSLKYAGEKRTKKEALERALSLKEELRSFSPGVETKAAFSNSAKSFSDDPSAQKNGGFLGSVFWGSTIEDFESVVFSLKKGVVSEPFETPYGFHLALVDSFGFSDYYYYPKKIFKDLSIKTSLKTLSFDSLSVFSSRFDSSVLDEASFKINRPFFNDVFGFLQNKQKEERLIGNKFSTLEWLGEYKKDGVFVVFNNKGFGLSWFLNILKQRPATRFPSLQKKSDFDFFVRSVCLEFLVLERARFLDIDSSVSYLRDFKNNYKNILYNEYVGFLVGEVSKKIDSLSVEEAYKKGVFNGDFLSPLSVVISEVRFSNFSTAKTAFNEFKNLNDFDFVLKKYNGDIREPIPKNKGGEVGLLAFSLKVGEVSNIIENNDGSFSFFKVLRFLEEEPFTLNLVYKQIERKLIKKEQESLKDNLLSFFLKKHSVEFYYDFIGL